MGEAEPSRAGRATLFSFSSLLRGWRRAEEGADEWGIVSIFLGRKSVDSVDGDGIRRMPAPRLFVSGAVCAQTFSTLFVVSVFYSRWGRLWDSSLHTLHNLPTVKYWQGLRADVGMCAYVCNDLVILAQRWILERYLQRCHDPDKKIYF